MNKLTIIGFASTRSVQIAAVEMHRMHMHFLELVLSR